MAARTWVTSICTATGVAVGVGAAQLGVGYGLNVVAWVPATEDSSRSVWLASLAWVTWLAANSTVIGAICADRLSGQQIESDQSPTAKLAWRAVIAVAAAIGALVTVPLVAIPARVAQQANNSAPHFTAGGYAVAGVIVGLIVALGALSVRAIAANILMSAAWFWILATIAVTRGLRLGEGVGVAQLATWQFHDAQWVRGMVNLPGALVMLVTALLVGFGAAWHPGRDGDHRVGVAVSGAMGPLLVATTYFLAVPGLDGQNQQLSAYVTAPYAVIAGLAGSVLVSALGAKGSREQSRKAREAREVDEHAQWQQSLSGDLQGGDPATEPKTTGRKGAGRKAASGSAPTETSQTPPAPDDPTAAPATGRLSPRRRRGTAKARATPDSDDTQPES